MKMQAGPKDHLDDRLRIQAGAKRRRNNAQLRKRGSRQEKGFNNE
jgi:hypothetical protein